MVKKPGRPGVWQSVAQKPDAHEKQRITDLCEDLIENFYKPRFLPDITPTQWNYVVDIGGAWSGGRYRFFQRYRSGMDHNTGEEFNAPFARMDRMGADRFDLLWHRHNGQWWLRHEGLTLDKAIETLKTDGLLHPV